VAQRLAQAEAQKSVNGACMIVKNQHTTFFTWAGVLAMLGAIAVAMQPSHGGKDLQHMLHARHYCMITCQQQSLCLVYEPSL
jgi:hypothetical protein